MELSKLAARLARRSQRNPETGCLEWTGCFQRYGIVRVAGRSRKAHRVAWELANGRPIPPGLNVLHRCDNGRCVEPQHLFLGTQADNVADMCSKGRNVPGRSLPGIAYRNAKLSVQAVASIRAAVAAGESRRAVARQHSISFQHAADIVSRKRWAHV